MKVLQIIDSLAAGGAETSLAEISAAYATLGVELHVGFFKPVLDVAGRLEDAGATLWPLTDARTRASRVAAIWKLTRQVRPDLVHTTLFEADVAGRIGARLAGVPVVSSFVNEMYGRDQRERGLSRRKLELARLADLGTARFVSKFHAISDTVAEVMADRLRIRRERVEVIPRGRDLARLGEWSAARRRKARQRLGLPDDAFVVLAVAREEAQKGLEVLIEASALLRWSVPDLQVLMAGRRGSASATLDTAVAAHQLETIVSRLGRRDDVPDLMVAADVLAFPSRWEGMGGTIIEAMALECPIVCSDIPVLREVLVDDRFAQFVPVGDPQSLAAALLHQANRPRDLARLAQARAAANERYEIAKVAGRMLDFYLTVERSPARNAARVRVPT